MPNAPATMFDTSQLPPAPDAGSSLWQPKKAMFWYDSIIDDMLANPGAQLKDIALRLGKSPVTIGLIARSDIFKARLQQRRQAFNEELNDELVGKLTRVASKALDATLTVLETKGEAVPLPVLTDIADKALSRLGYGVSKGPQVQVNVNAPQQTVIAPVSPEALRSARQNLQTLEASRFAAPPIDASPSGEVSVVASGAGEGSEGAL